MRKIYSLLIFMAVGFLQLNAADYNLTTDSLALVDFYNSTGGNWASDSWNVKPLSEWAGVVVDSVDGQLRVTELSTEGLELSGEVPASIGNLTGLSILKLLGAEDGLDGSGTPYIVDLKGTIPPEIWNLTNLERLQIKFTNITGDIPIPDTGLAHMTKLYEINFQQTLLGCEIPDSLFTLPALTKAYLHESNFIGDVPSSLKKAKNLTRLYLQNNQLDSLPFVELTSPGSAKVQLYGNYFSFETVKAYHDANATTAYKSLKDSYQYAKAAVDTVVAYGSDFTINGTVPASSVSDTRMYLWYKDNYTSTTAMTAKLDFTGFGMAEEGTYECQAQSSLVEDFYISTIYNITNDIAESLERDSLALVEFYNNTGADWASDSWLVKPISEWAGVAVDTGNSGEVRVTEFSTEGLELSGTISPAIGALSDLEILKLLGDENGLDDSGTPYIVDLNGSIPAEIWKLTNLERLQIKFTNVTGDIPTDGIEDMTSLYEINFQQTLLGCEIPDELFELPALTKAYLHESNFIGDVPSTLAKATNLSRLYLQNNQLDSLPYVQIADQSSCKVQLYGNYFSFETVKPYHDADDSVSYKSLKDSYQYAKATADTTVDYLSNFTINGTVDNGEMYLWYKDEQNSTTANTAALSFTDFSMADVGTYECQAQSSLVEEFYISTVYNISNDVDPLEGDSLALVEFYNNTGADWATDSWLVKPLNEWAGVVVDTGNSGDVRVTEFSTEGLELSGTISPAIGALSDLEILKLLGAEDGLDDSGTPYIVDLNGSIPTEIWKLTNLERLQIKYTNVTGDIPTDGIDNMTSLYEINFQQTLLGCEIPAELFELPALTKAYLHESNFIGDVPSSLSEATSLSRLYLQNNKLDSLPYVQIDDQSSCKVQLYGNYFSFETVKPYHDADDSSSYAGFKDSYQFGQDTISYDTLIAGDAITFDFEVEDAEVYTWIHYANDTTTLAFSAAISYTIDSLTTADTGLFVSAAQSSLVSEFEIIGVFVVENVIDTTTQKDDDGIEISSMVSLSIYPNPFNESLTVKGDAVIESVAIYNITGKQVLGTVANSTIVNLDTQELSSGIYYIRIAVDGNVITKKVIK